mmetsp:Transcript_5662/g.22251  ORF Transcript_5662/g.22251 Transcript_5662/m.22251 type:complete len:200 (-) Transcript_5662:2337-2936(-)
MVEAPPPSPMMSARCVSVSASLVRDLFARMLSRVSRASETASGGPRIANRSDPLSSPSLPSLAFDPRPLPRRELFSERSPTTAKASARRFVAWNASLLESEAASMSSLSKRSVCTNDVGSSTSCAKKNGSAASTPSAGPRKRRTEGLRLLRTSMAIAGKSLSSFLMLEPACPMSGPTAALHSGRTAVFREARASLLRSF